jgi:hypothetical protein
MIGDERKGIYNGCERNNGIRIYREPTVYTYGLLPRNCLELWISRDIFGGANGKQLPVAKYGPCLCSPETRQVYDAGLGLHNSKGSLQL